MTVNSSGYALLTIAVSTMFGRGVVDKFLKPSYIVIDQGEKVSCSKSTLDGYHFTNSRGLSLSRNEALRLCDTKYLLFADDDVTHIDEGVQQIVDEFERTGADILTFMIRTPEGIPFKHYKDHPFKHNRSSLFKVNSIEIAVKVNAVRSAGLRFDPRFGLGAQYPTGEEIIFLQDACRVGLDIRFSPINIVVHPKESSGSNLLGNDVLILAKGAMFVRIFGIFAYLYCIAFSLKHFRKSGYSCAKFLSLMFKGCGAFLRSSDRSCISQ